MKPNEDEILGRFGYKLLTPKKGEDLVNIRLVARDLARLLVDKMPDSRELALALTKLEEVVLWANTGLARKDA